MLLTILLIVLLVSLLGGGLGYGKWGAAGMSPAGILLVVLVIMLFTGHRFTW